MVKYLLGPTNRGHGASKVLNSFALEFNIEYVPFYSWRGLLIWLKSFFNRKPVVYAPAISRYSSLKTPGYVRDVMFILSGCIFFPFRRHHIYFINSQINFKSRLVSPFLYYMIRNRIIIGPAKPKLISNREILFYYADNMLIDPKFSYEIKEELIVWHLGYNTVEKGWYDFINLARRSSLKFMYAGREEVFELPSHVTHEPPADYVANLFNNELNVFLFLSKTDLFPLVVIEAIQRGFVIVTITGSVSESILNDMFRGRNCFLSINRIEDLSLPIIKANIMRINRELNHFAQMQTLSKKYG